MSGLKRRGVWPRGPYAQRGSVVVPVVVCSVMLIGFAALAVDVGHLYCTRAELQRTADAAAMAAASELGDYSQGDPLPRARSSAQELATRNTVLGSGIVLDSATDIAFGRVVFDGSKYSFSPSEFFSNAVQVRVRRTADSPNGAVPLFFANVFGQSSKDLSAQATAILTPRDVVFVLDLSGSHNDDSCLRSYKNTEIANRSVWESIWDETLAESMGEPRPIDNGQPGGPLIGNMSQWGDDHTDVNWDFANDAGLVRLPKTGTWTLNGTFLSQTLNAKGFGSYVASEVTGVNTTPSSYKSGDTATTYYRRRVRVALGIDRWKSGKAGGQAGGNGDSYINSNEVEPMIPYPSESSNPATFCKEMGGSWNGFVDYVADSNSLMCQYNPSSLYFGDPGLRYRFGLKTFVDYLQEKQNGDAASPGLGGAKEQPMGAVADAAKTAMEIIEELDGNDMVGMVGYGTYGYGPQDYPNNLSWLTDEFPVVRAKVDTLQAAMWSGSTNLAQGIDEGVNVLKHSSASPERTHAAKVMILLTDGMPNYSRNNQYTCELPVNQNSQPRVDARAAAQEAWNDKIQIYTISVGANADQVLMETIAQIGHGQHFHAEGSVDTYRQELRDVFEKLGGKRPIQLIQ